MAGNTPAKKAPAKKVAPAKKAAAKKAAPSVKQAAVDAGGLSQTGNPHDLSTKPGAVDAKIGHQDGAPEDLAKADDAARAVGYVGPDQEAGKPSKPDYSQGNADVMNGGK